MKLSLRPIPVIFACKGCDLDGSAQRAAAEFDRRGLGEAAVAGRDSARARSRYPIYVIEGCAKACAAGWLASQGVKPQQSFVLDPARDAAPQIERIAGAL
jgi:uncharacterized metal-binding protein